ncbi:hypothetical protein I3842_11G132900 [Carya illinoinensis]|uniref:DUF4378 domain-containing protein n=1 Tax=Carya illinoinensis TaxID=32201 RepID=A0A922DQ50_CARIL|nr:hypothetical protein I3842_11G132900 [Carya illinoinensis]KAG6688595.1 hypothetical protein I3842_11G132900 [Carya illinoinensis]
MKEEKPSEKQTEKKIVTDKMRNSQRKPVNSLLRNHGTENKTCQGSCGIPVQVWEDVVNTEHYPPSHKRIVDISLNKLIPSASTKEFCKEVHPKKRRSYGCKSISCVDYDRMKGINLQPAQTNEAEETGNQKFSDRKYLSRDEAGHESKQLSDALKILNSNKELFIELLQDPNSLLVKRIHGLKNSQVKGSQTQFFPGAKLSEYQICNMRQHEESASPERLKSCDRYLPKGSGDPIPSDRIVVLTPGPTSIQKSAERVESYFSLQYPFSLRIKGQSARPALFSFGRVKRKLKSVLGFNKKERHWMPIKKKLEKSLCDCEGSEDGGNILNTKVAGIKLPSGVLDVCGMEKSSLDVGKTDKTQKHALLPTLNPGRDWEIGFSLGQKRFSPYGNHQMIYENRCGFQKERKHSCLSYVKKNIEALPSDDAMKPNDPLQVPETKPNISENHFADIKVKEYDMSPIGETKALDVPSESYSTHQGGPNHGTGTLYACEKIGYMESSRLHSSSKNQQLKFLSEVSVSNSSSYQRVEDSENQKDQAMQPSQLSVLEKVFTENLVIPSSNIYQPAELPVEALQVNFEGHHPCAEERPPLGPKINVTTTMNGDASYSEYISAVLQASGLNWDELSIKCHSSEQLPDQSLFNGLKMSNNQFCGAFMLLFDCINEVLAEACQSNSGSSPWILCIKPIIQPLTVDKTVIQEVRKCVDRYLLPQPPPQTPQQLAEQDLARSRTWLHIGEETEDIAIEMVEGALEELLMEIILELYI